jgi:molybdopterin-containing oxidoreductase family iron-sulfur binding subunit
MSSEGKVPSSNDSSTQGRVIWRSLEEKVDPSRNNDAACGSDVVKQHVAPKELFQLNRRKFMTLSGSIAALAGMEGCIRRPEENIMPYTMMPEYVNPGFPAHYATVMNQSGEAVGVLATSREGRPTKLEGNPDHPTSRGATNIWIQSSILDLYDPDRLQGPRTQGQPSDFATFDAFFAKKLAELKAKSGSGLHILVQPSNSPTFLRMREQLLNHMPLSRLAIYTPVPDSNAREATRLAFGQPANVVYDYSRAKVVLALDSDFLGTDPGSTLATRQFAAARDMDSAAGTMNRLYSVEPLLSVTGSNADHRLRLPAQDVARYARALAAELANGGLELGQLSAAVKGASLEGVPEPWIKAVAADLLKNRGQSLVVVGPRQPVAVHALAFALNRALGNAGITVTYTETVDTLEPDNFESLKSLLGAIQLGKVDTLVILGGNPVLNAPADLKFSDALQKVPTTIAFSEYLDETSSMCTWQVPRAHELESWGDQQSTQGDYSVQQPLIAPLWGGRTDSEVLAVIGGEPNWRAYNLVQATVERRGLRGELTWRRLLHAGVADTRFGAVLGALPLRDAEIAAALQKLGEAPAAGVQGDQFEVVFALDNKLHDGRYANNQWLLELPDPITRIVWDNAALIAPSTAKQLGIKSGDMIRLSANNQSIDIVAWVQPGTAAKSIILPIGWGRSQAGRFGTGIGFDVYPLRTVAHPHFMSGVTLAKLDKRYTLVQTQEHDTMAGRPLAVDATLDEYKETPNFPEYKTPDAELPPLWVRQDYSKGYQWGMTIDLTTCSGCSACVIACQAENNIPTVGKLEVSRGREMHWMRIDRYYVGENEDEPDVAFQPIACQHCEEAPCENVCPVAATSHSKEGLNDIAYNRCIGTRYCLNNCPYKVRRFNFLNFNLDIPETRQMQFNPSVTVRFRGVIEKCSYCVQRIEGARIVAHTQNRKIRESEVISACAQACSAGSITFGDINDPSHEVSKKRKRDRNYALLSELGTHPRTRFLGKIRNPNPEMKTVKA